MPYTLPISKKAGKKSKKAGNTSENLLIEFIKSYIFCIKKNKLLKKYITI